MVDQHLHKLGKSMEVQTGNARQACLNRITQTLLQFHRRYNAGEIQAQLGHKLRRAEWIKSSYGEAGFQRVQQLLLQLDSLDTIQSRP